MLQVTTQYLMPPGLSKKIVVCSGSRLEIRHLDYNLVTRPSLLITQYVPKKETAMRFPTSHHPILANISTSIPIVCHPH